MGDDEMKIGRGEIMKPANWEEFKQLVPLINNRVVGVTGHRPQNLGGFSRVTTLRLTHLTRLLFTKSKPARVNTGMALGFDLAIAKRCYNMGIPFKAFIPCKGQENVWGWYDQTTYRHLLTRAVQTVIVAPEYTRTCMKVRDMMLVRDSEVIVALWDGDQQQGGTTHTINVARAEGKTVINLWQLWENTSTLKEEE